MQSVCLLRNINYNKPKKAIFLIKVTLYKYESKRGLKNKMSMLFSQVAADAYKTSSQAINSEARKDVRAKSLKGIMKESFFHGASFMGSNFIA